LYSRPLPWIFAPLRGRKESAFGMFRESKERVVAQGYNGGPCVMGEMPYWGCVWTILFSIGECVEKRFSNTAESRGLPASWEHQRTNIRSTKQTRCLKTTASGRREVGMYAFFVVLPEIVIMRRLRGRHLPSITSQEIGTSIMSITIVLA